MDRAAIFVDGGNMFFAQKANGWWIDWKPTNTAPIIVRFTQRVTSQLRHRQTEGEVRHLG